MRANVINGCDLAYICNGRTSGILCTAPFPQEFAELSVLSGKFCNLVEKLCYHFAFRANILLDHLALSTK